MIKDIKSQVTDDIRLNKGTPTGIIEPGVTEISRDVRRQKAKITAAKIRIWKHKKYRKTKEEQLAKAWPVTPWPPK